MLGVAGETVLFAASDEPSEEQVWSWDAGAGLTRLTDEPGLHRAPAGAGGTRIVSSHTGSGHRFTASNPTRAHVAVAYHEAEPLVRPQVTWLEIGERRLRTALLLRQLAFFAKWLEPTRPDS